MLKEKKARVIERTEESFQKSSIGIVTDYRGLTAGEMGSLRRKLKESGMEFRVVKNTLSRLAAEKLGRKDLGGLFVGPVAIAFGRGDETQAARILDEYIRINRSTLSIKGGFLGASPLTAGDISALSMLPPRNVLIARVLGGFQSPIAGLANVLNAPIRGLAVVLQGRIKQLEGN